jgi:hypothetical protein
MIFSVERTATVCSSMDTFENFYIWQVFPSVNTEHTLINIGSIIAVSDRVEHYIFVVAVRGQVGTQARGVREDTRVLASNGTGNTLHRVVPGLSVPGPLEEMIIVTVVEGRCLGGVQAKLELHHVWPSGLEPDTVVQLISTTGGYGGLVYILHQ